jgi:uncharacterized protein (DUF39 family)
LVGHAKSADAAYGRPASLNGEEATICTAAAISFRIVRAPVMQLTEKLNSDVPELVTPYQVSLAADG